MALDYRSSSFLVKMTGVDVYLFRHLCLLPVVLPVEYRADADLSLWLTLATTSVCAWSVQLARRQPRVGIRASVIVANAGHVIETRFNHIRRRVIKVKRTRIMVSRLTQVRSLLVKKTHI
jgi:hypothetical protein